MKKLPIAITLSALFLAGAGIASAANQPSRSYHDSIYRAEQQGTRTPRMERKAPPPEMKQGPQDGMKNPPKDKKAPQIKKTRHTKNTNPRNAAATTKMTNAPK